MLRAVGPVEIGRHVRHGALACLQPFGTQGLGALGTTVLPPPPQHTNRYQGKNPQQENQQKNLHSLTPTSCGAVPFAPPFPVCMQRLPSGRSEDATDAAPAQSGFDRDRMKFLLRGGRLPPENAPRGELCPVRNGQRGWGRTWSSRVLPLRVS